MISFLIRQNCVDSPQLLHTYIYIRTHCKNLRALLGWMDLRACIFIVIVIPIKTCFCFNLTPHRLLLIPFHYCSFTEETHSYILLFLMKVSFWGLLFCLSVESFRGKILLFFNILLSSRQNFPCIYILTSVCNGSAVLHEEPLYSDYSLYCVVRRTSDCTGSTLSGQSIVATQEVRWSGIPMDERSCPDWCNKSCGLLAALTPCKTWS